MFSDTTFRAIPPSSSDYTIMRSDIRKTFSLVCYCSSYNKFIMSWTSVFNEATFREIPHPLPSAWWEKYLPKRSLFKHTCSWRDKHINIENVSLMNIFLNWRNRICNRLNESCRVRYWGSSERMFSFLMQFCSLT